MPSTTAPQTYDTCRLSFKVMAKVWESLNVKAARDFAEGSQQSGPEGVRGLLPVVHEVIRRILNRSVILRPFVQPSRTVIRRGSSAPTGLAMCTWRVSSPASCKWKGNAALVQLERMLRVTSCNGRVGSSRRKCRSLC